MKYISILKKKKKKLNTYKKTRTPSNCLVNSHQFYPGPVSVNCCSIVFLIYFCGGQRVRISVTMANGSLLPYKTILVHIYRKIEYFGH